MEGWTMIHKIKAMYDKGNGYSKKQISEDLSISRNTVRKYVDMDEEEIVAYVRDPKRVKLLDEYKDYIVLQLHKYPKLKATKIKRKLEAKISKEIASERTYRNYVSELKKTTAVKQQRYYEPVIDMVAGVQCQVDMGESRGVMIGGKPTTIYFAVFVLSYSRMIYVGVSDRPINTKLFIQMHDEAFTYFDGVGEECVYDQTKLVVIKEEFREVWFNEEFYRYATVARFDIRVCEGYDPESKGKVEAGVKYFKNDFLYGDEFESLDELKESRLKWFNEVANVRIHGAMKRRPREVYESEEKGKMKPYMRPFYLIQEDAGQSREVDKTSLISHRANKYSVPMKYQSSTVMVQEEGTKLVIRDIETRDVIAVHDLCKRKGGISKNNNHYRDYQKLISDKETEIGELIGNELSERLCKVMKKTSPKIYKDQLAGLIQLLKQYTGKDSLNEALDQLSGRRRLTVTYIRDYLSAMYSEKDRTTVVENSLSGQKTGILGMYGCLVTEAREVSAYGKL